MRRFPLVWPGITLAILAVVVSLWAALQMPRYEPDFRLSSVEGLEPISITRTPWRNLIRFQVAGDVESVAEKATAEVLASKPTWKVRKGAQGIQIEDQSKVDGTRREGVRIARGPQEGQVYIQLNSPTYEPNWLQRWWYNVNGQQIQEIRRR